VWLWLWLLDTPPPPLPTQNSWIQQGRYGHGRTTFWTSVYQSGCGHIYSCSTSKLLATALFLCPFSVFWQAFQYFSYPFQHLSTLLFHRLHTPKSDILRVGSADALGAGPSFILRPPSFHSPYSEGHFSTNYGWIRRVESSVTEPCDHLYSVPQRSSRVPKVPILYIQLLLVTCHAQKGASAL
jgi:hypothetical protein